MRLALRRLLIADVDSRRLTNSPSSPGTIRRPFRCDGMPATRSTFHCCKVLRLASPLGAAARDITAKRVELRVLVQTARRLLHRDDVAIRRIGDAGYCIGGALRARKNKPPPVHAAFLSSAARRAPHKNTLALGSTRCDAAQFDAALCESARPCPN